MLSLEFSRVAVKVMSASPTVTVAVVLSRLNAGIFGVVVLDEQAARKLSVMMSRLRLICEG